MLLQNTDEKEQLKLRGFLIKLKPIDFVYL